MTQDLYDKGDGLPVGRENVAALTYSKKEVYDPSRDFVYDPRNTLDNLEEQEDFDILKVFRIIFQNKLLILACLILGILGGVLFAAQKTPLFRAVATIEVQEQEAQIVNGGTVEQNTRADADFMATQFALMKSRSLAEQVVVNLGLENNESFANPESQRNARIRQATNNLIRNLQARPVDRSRVVSISFVNPDPDIAAAVPNAVADSYIKTTLERKFNTTSYARNFLEQRLAQAKATLETAERELVEYAESNEILELDQSGDQSSLVSSDLVRLSEEVSIARSERIRHELAFRQLQNGDATVLANETPLLQSLIQERNALISQYQTDLLRHQPTHPDMVGMQQRIAQLDERIDDERTTVQDAELAIARGAYQTALAREQALNLKLDSSKDELRGLRSRRVNYTILQRDLDTARSQYDALLQRLKEVSMAAGAISSQISVVDRAIAPRSPFTPNIPLILVLATFIGLNLGVGAAILREFLDNSIKTPEDVKSKLKLPALGVVPLFAGNAGAVNQVAQSLSAKNSSFLEAYFSATTALKYTTNMGIPKSLLVTSTQPEEGKSTSSLALGIALSRSGKSVLIIDADLRKPSFVADTDDSFGLSGLLTSDRNLEDNILYSNEYDLHLLPSGLIPPNPAELLSGVRLKEIILKAESLYDVVIVDAPPMLNFADSVVLGAACEAAMVVVKSGGVRTPAAQKTVERLRLNKVNVVGAILTHFNAKKSGYSYNYYYYAYGKGAEAYGKEKKKSQKSARRKIRLFQTNQAD